MCYFYNFSVHGYINIMIVMGHLQVYILVCEWENSLLFINMLQTEKKLCMLIGSIMSNYTIYIVV